ncbi:uncharacterized protein LOC135107266 [Scylla paramamosain]|uniref:uncharacterized protein LOC135107266 n=1 Tax=Scylla paramamosain TaxID=85552 RepID=UPI0030829072
MITRSRALMVTSTPKRGTRLPEESLPLPSPLQPPSTAVEITKRRARIVTSTPKRDARLPEESLPLPSTAVEITKKQKRMVNSTNKRGIKPPEELPRLPTMPSKHCRSSFYRKKKDSKSASKGGSTPARKLRCRPGTVALREIRHYQSTWNTLIPKLPFSRLVREILADLNRDLRIQSLALEALQESADVFLIGLLGRANMCCIHAHRVTIMPSDMKLVQEVREDYM